MNIFRYRLSRFAYTNRLRSNFWDLTMSRFWRTLRTSLPFLSGQSENGMSLLEEFS